MKTKVCLLTMPEKMEEITVKVINSPYLVGDDVYCDVRIWGDNNRDNIFRMKISKTFWHSLYKELVERFELGGDFGESIDNQLECIAKKVVTIRAIPDIKRAYTNKKGEIDSPKIFRVQLREDLEEAERLGGDVYLKAIKREVNMNRTCHRIIKENINRLNSKNPDISKSPDVSKSKITSASLLDFTVMV